MTAPWPTETPSPSTTGLPLSTWKTQLSCTLLRAPIVMGSLSARNTAPYQTLAPAPIVTEPARVALGATQASLATCGTLSPSAICMSPTYPVECSADPGGDRADREVDHEQR